MLLSALARLPAPAPLERPTASTLRLVGLASPDRGRRVSTDRAHASRRQGSGREARGDWRRALQPPPACAVGPACYSLKRPHTDSSPGSTATPVRLPTLSVDTDDRRHPLKHIDAWRRSFLLIGRGGWRFRRLRAVRITGPHRLPLGPRTHPYWLRWSSQDWSGPLRCLRTCSRMRSTISSRFGTRRRVSSAASMRRARVPVALSGAVAIACS